jgi:hypothetical protein
MSKSKTRPYRIWRDMRRRCNCVSRVGYENYGGRGISYDHKWETFEGFWEDMEGGYSDKLTLERIDVNGNYQLSNCKWVEKSEQARNKRGYSNNTLGMPNMKIINNKGIKTLQVRLQNTKTGKRVNKWFSLNLYTLDQAVKKAEDWLNLKRKEFCYGETHGT